MTEHMKFIFYRIIFFAYLSILSTAVNATQRPNIILVMADDLGYGDIGVNGQDLINTPHLDSMAREGVLLSNFYASAPNCTPSRAGLMTGRYAIRMGLAAKVLFVEDTHGLPESELSMAEMFQDNAYVTAMLGKWHLGHTAQYWPTSHGFDYFFGLPYSNNQTPLALYRNESIIEKPVDQSSLTQRYTNEAIKFLKRQDEQPFFLYIAHTFPHLPLHVSDDFAGRSRAGLYGDVVEELDWSMGQIFQTLKELKLDENTLVIFTSDNGPYPQGSPGRLRGSKGTAWEGGFKVPFIARWPGKITAGSHSASIAMNIDLLPTLAAISDFTLADDLVLDGRNIWSLLKGHAEEIHEKLYFFYDDKIAAVRTQNFKMLLAAPYTGMRRWFPGYNLNYLFDMNKDPEEQYSVTERHPDIWKKMQEYLLEGQNTLEKQRDALPVTWNKKS